jgi:hypothetical protein
MTEAAAYAPGGAEERTGLTSAQSRSSQVHPEPNGGQAADGRLVAAPAPPQGAPQGGVDGVLPPPPEPLKLRVWKLFEDPQSSQAAFILALFLLTLILVSCLAFCLQTIGVFYAGDQTVWEYTEVVCIIAFTIEYLLRLMAAPHRMTFVKSGLNIIDLVAILPFYLEAMLSGTDVAGLAVFRIVRLARVFRLFKLGRYSDGLKTFATTMSQSTRPLAMLLFFMVIAIVLFSSAIYYVERGNWDEVRRVWWRDGNLGRAQGLNEEDDRLVFYTACAGTVDMTLNSSRLVNSTLRSSINVHFRTTAPFVGSGVAKRTVPKLAFRAGGGAQATDHHYQVPDHLVPLPDGALSANASAWVASQSWAAAMVTAGVSWDDFTFGADPWARATCRSDFPLDNEQEECFDERNNWPEIGTRAIVEHVKGLVVAKAGHNVSVVVSGLECEELGCLYCNNPSPFDSIPASFYWSAVTMTTVGYGDVFPVTWGGQLVACFTMMTGILVRVCPSGSERRC